MGKGEQIPPSILEKPKIIKDEVKKTVRFEVKLRAKPDAQITWLKEKTTLTNGKKYKIETKKEADNTFLLILEISVILITTNSTIGAHISCFNRTLALKMVAYTKFKPKTRVVRAMLIFT